jgi:hypothetical protein
VARIRTIKPEIFDDPDVGALAPLARWLFIGLLTQADRRGRLADEPKRLKLRLLGFDAKADCDALLTDLCSTGMIIRYEVEGKAYIQVRSFEKHQRPHPAEAESTIPAYSSENVKLHGEPCNATASKNLVRRSKPCTDTGSLDTGSLDTGSLDRSSSPNGDGFDAFWESYPRKIGKGVARSVWKRLTPSPPRQALILAAVQKQRTCLQWLSDGGQFIPHPATWLRQGRWDDDPDTGIPSLTDKTMQTMQVGKGFTSGMTLDGQKKLHD